MGRKKSTSVVTNRTTVVTNRPASNTNPSSEYDDAKADVDAEAYVNLEEDGDGDA